jgi:hypothetical protein
MNKMSFVKRSCIPLIALVWLVGSRADAQVPLGLRSRQTVEQSFDEALVAALRTDDIDAIRDETASLFFTAETLPPHTLQDTTVKALSDKVMTLTRRIRAQFEADPTSRHEGDADSALVQNLILILKKQKNPVGIDGLVTVVPFYATVADLAELGELAVPALVRRARKPESTGEVGHINGALDALEQMLEQPAIRATLSARSRTQIRQVAAERMKNLGRPETAWSTLAHASYLAVATGDPRLRKQVSDLVASGVEQSRRGIVDLEKQQWFQRVIGEALEKKFQD